MSRGRSRKDRKSEPRAVRGVLGAVLAELGLDEVARAARVCEFWDQAVGPEVASHSRPEGLRGEVLEVAVESSVWSQQLQMKRPQILASLREYLGDDAPQDLRLRVGYSRPREAGGSEVGGA